MHVRTHIKTLDTYISLHTKCGKICVCCAWLTICVLRNATQSAINTTQSLIMVVAPAAAYNITLHNYTCENVRTRKMYAFLCFFRFVVVIAVVVVRERERFYGKVDIFMWKQQRHAVRKLFFSFGYNHSSTCQCIWTVCIWTQTVAVLWPFLVGGWGISARSIAILDYVELVECVRVCLLYANGCLSIEGKRQYRNNDNNNNDDDDSNNNTMVFLNGAFVCMLELILAILRTNTRM